MAGCTNISLHEDDKGVRVDIDMTGEHHNVSIFHRIEGHDIPEIIQGLQRAYDNFAAAYINEPKE